MILLFRRRLAYYLCYSKLMKNPSASMIGTIVAIYNVGSMVGCLIVAVIGDRLSRRGTIFVGCVIIVVGAALQAASFGVPQLIVVRIITVPLLRENADFRALVPGSLLPQYQPTYVRRPKPLFVVHLSLRNSPVWW